MVQAGIFRDAEAAQRAGDELAAAGVPTAIATAKIGEATIYMVRSTALASRTEAEALAERIRRGKHPAVVMNAATLR